MNVEDLNYVGRKVRVVNFDNWSNFGRYTHVQDYIGKTGIIKDDFGIGGHRFTIIYTDENFQNIDNSNGNLCFRFENLYFPTDKQEIKTEKEGNEMSINKIEVGMKVKQIKELPRFNYIGTEFEITEIVDSIVMCKNGMMGFGLSENDFFTYFEVVQSVIKEEIEFVIIETVDGIKTTRKGLLTLVELPDGSQGASKPLPQDEYDAQRGYDIAFLKADIGADEKVIKMKRKKLEELRKF